ncbi:MAG TPA: glycoside hydrolase family 3 C-terminal domain-containing protein [Abditibacteriaceae bacterium]|jgi:beta-glucosidase
MKNLLQGSLQQRSIMMAALLFFSQPGVKTQAQNATTAPVNQTPVTATVVAPLTTPSYPFQNPDLPVEARIDNIISLMTLDEKIECLDTDPSVPRLGIKGTGHVEGLHGLAQGGPANWGSRRLGPIPTTTFPQSIGLGQTWDTGAIRLAASIEGKETRYIVQSQKYGRASLVVRAPNADLGRDPRWGRNEECYGEDALLTGTLATWFIRGLQGDHPKYWQTAALMKHFMANSNEDTRTSSSSDFDQRLLHEYYAMPFRMGVLEGGSRAYMASYNAVNGVPMTVNPILKNLTVNVWGQDGIICTDGGALRLLVSDHKAFPDLETASAACIKAGINQFLDTYREGVRGALTRNLLTEADIDKVLRGDFRVMIRLGLLDPASRVPYTSIKGTDDPWQSAEHKAAARLVTQKSIVLLKNSNNLLPLNKNTIKSIALVGPRANEVYLDWYSGTPPYTVTPLQGIKNKVGANVTVDYAPNNESNAAVDLARKSDVVIVCVGNNPIGASGWAKVNDASEGREAVDRKSIDLEPAQEELIRQVHAVNPKTVVALIASFPYAINWAQQNVPAIVHMAHNSQEEGNALADVLFGDYNPAGRLVQTWPRSLAQLPPLLDYNIRHGRTYMYFKGQPLYPFGYGLSYTTFSYSGLRKSADTLRPGGMVMVSVTVRNTGKRAGDEVVQLYVRHLNSAVERPQKELKSFARVSLQPGEAKEVRLPIQADKLAYWNERTQSFEVENTQLNVMIGSSSADIKRQTTLNVKAR